MANILIIGATSAIAKATARRYAKPANQLYLIGKAEQKLVLLSKDLLARGAARVEIGTLDVSQFDQHQSVIDVAFQAFGSIDIILIAHGTLPDQKQCQDDHQACIEQININGVGTVSLLTILANRLDQQRGGTIAVISSVAGDRGRQSNYVYGSAKSLVSVFLQGLRNRLHQSGVTVIDIKPGFVDTPMTAAFSKGALWASPEKVAADITKAIDKGKHTLYTPFFWRYIMLIIRLIPESIFKKLSL